MENKGKKERHESKQAELADVLLSNGLTSNTRPHALRLQSGHFVRNKAFSNSFKYRLIELLFFYPADYIPNIKFMFTLKCLQFFPDV